MILDYEEIQKKLQFLGRGQKKRDFKFWLTRKI